MLILGLSPFKHDTAAALFEDGILKAAIENDKLVRSKSTGIPEQAIRFCLERAGANSRDLDKVAVATRPFSGWRRRSLLPASLGAPSPVSSILHEASELGVLAREQSQLRMLRKDEGQASKVENFEHHLCHAASAFYLSPYDRALILTMDEEGDGCSGTVAVGEGTRIRVLQKIFFPHSLAWIYTQITRVLGFTPHHDEHKTQWLSVEGEPVFKDVFFEMLRYPRNHLPHLKSSFVKLSERVVLSAQFYRKVGLPEGECLSDDARRGLASSLQFACTEIVASIVERFFIKESLQKVCLGGGLFQNALLVASLERRLGMNKVFVPPSPGNAGCALGAGLLAWHSAKQRPRLPAVHSISNGPPLMRTETKDVLDNCKSRYSLQTTEERKLDATVHLLQSGKIVGWAQGPAEFGSRALGNRSLLAAPWAAYVKENLNDYIKHREWFRPFAVAVPEEDAARYFEYSDLCQSMNSLAKAKPDGSSLLEGFILRGNLLRLHVVRQKSNPLFWRLLKRFGERAPVPMLVNTSFNLFGEPLVVTPRDVVRSYFCSGVDALVIDNFLLSKTGVASISVGVSISAQTIDMRRRV